MVMSALITHTQDQQARRRHTPLMGDSLMTPWAASSVAGPYGQHLTQNGVPVPMHQYLSLHHDGSPSLVHGQHETHRLMLSPQLLLLQSRLRLPLLPSPSTASANVFPSSAILSQPSSTLLSSPSGEYTASSSNSSKEGPSAMRDFSSTNSNALDLLNDREKCRRFNLSSHLHTDSHNDLMPSFAHSLKSPEFLSRQAASLLDPDLAKASAQYYDGIGPLQQAYIRERHPFIHKEEMLSLYGMWPPLGTLPNSRLPIHPDVAALHAARRRDYFLCRDTLLYPSDMLVDLPSPATSLSMSVSAPTASLHYSTKSIHTPSSSSATAPTQSASIPRSSSPSSPTSALTAGAQKLSLDTPVSGTIISSTSSSISSSISSSFTSSFSTITSPLTSSPLKNATPPSQVSPLSSSSTPISSPSLSPTLLKRGPSEQSHQSVSSPGPMRRPLHDTLHRQLSCRRKSSTSRKFSLEENRDLRPKASPITRPKLITSLSMPNGSNCLMLTGSHTAPDIEAKTTVNAEIIAGISKIPLELERTIDKFDSYRALPSHPPSLTSPLSLQTSFQCAHPQRTDTPTTLSSPAVSPSEKSTELCSIWRQGVKNGPSAYHVSERVGRSEKMSYCGSPEESTSKQFLHGAFTTLPQQWSRGIFYQDLNNRACTNGTRTPSPIDTNDEGSSSAGCCDGRSLPGKELPTRAYKQERVRDRQTLASALDTERKNAERLSNVKKTASTQTQTQFSSFTSGASPPPPHSSSPPPPPPYHTTHETIVASHYHHLQGQPNHAYSRPPPTHPYYVNSHSPSSIHGSKTSEPQQYSPSLPSSQSCVGDTSPSLSSAAAPSSIPSYQLYSCQSHQNQSDHYAYSSHHHQHHNGSHYHQQYHHNHRHLSPSPPVGTTPTLPPAPPHVLPPHRSTPPPPPLPPYPGRSHMHAHYHPDLEGGADVQQAPLNLSVSSSATPPDRQSPQPNRRISSPERDCLSPENLQRSNSKEEDSIEEHFRRSLGKSYPEPPTPTVVQPVPMPVESTPDKEEKKNCSVDDHFARALGNQMWTEIKARSEVPSIETLPNTVDAHFAKALGASMWRKLKEDTNKTPVYPNDILLQKKPKQQQTGKAQAGSLQSNGKNSPNSQHSPVQTPMMT